MGCVRCGITQEVGALCRSCAAEVAPSIGLIPDHIRSTVEPSDALAWLVDGFGGAHAIGAQGVIGRNQDGDLVVLASSVSREHAEIKQVETGWTVRDLGSRNGTFVNGLRIESPTELPSHAVVKVGDVPLWFLAEIAPDPPHRPPMATGGAGGGLVRYQLAHDRSELCVMAGEDAVAGGALLWRPVGGDGWTERSLAPLEFQLLRALCVRANEEAASPSAIRGCVPTKQLVRDLPFQSKYANQENVRQVVLRLRNVLAEVGAGGVLAVAPGRGYYLACRVTASQADIMRR
jgi:hypothetical protein